MIGSFSVMMIFRKWFGREKQVSFNIRESMELLKEMNPEAILFPELESAYIGFVSQQNVRHLACYSFIKIIENLMNEMSYEEALDYFGYNIEGSYLGENTPVILQDSQ